jgi:hypothetical protein
LLGSRVSKNNLVGGAILLALSSYSVGADVERLIWATNVSPIDYIFLLFFGGMLFAAIKIFRMGLASTSADSTNSN